MKLSKKYPAIALLKKEKKANLPFEKLFNVIQGSKTTRDITPLKGIWRQMYDKKQPLVNSIHRAKWYEPCKSLLGDAGKSYEKLLGEKINEGVFIISGLNFQSSGEDVLALASVSNSGEVSIAGVSSIPIPEFFISCYFGSEDIRWLHSSGDMGVKTEQAEQVRMFYFRVVATLLFLQNCGPEAKEMMTASIPKKRNTLRRDVNDLGIKRIRLTASWYRDTVQGHPFMVSGHWRKQRHGEGLEKVKQKYITPYMKKGYRSKPQKDNLG
jgi:hypothetical protein